MKECGSYLEVGSYRRETMIDCCLKAGHKGMHAYKWKNKVKK